MAPGRRSEKSKPVLRISSVLGNMVGAGREKEMAEPEAQAIALLKTAKVTNPLFIFLWSSVSASVCASLR